jgi:Holliday junction resolvase RusA-like endonuclease
MALEYHRTSDGVGHWTGPGYQAADVPMEPFGKARPRVTVRGTYMPAEYQSRRAVLRAAFGSVTVAPPWVVRVTAVRAIPASWSKRKRAAMAGAWCETKPDIDNCIGGVLDAIFDEDAAVVSVSGVKVWGAAHALRVEVWTAGIRPGHGETSDAAVAAS